MYRISPLDQNGGDCAQRTEIRNGNGTVVCDFSVHATEAQNGTVRAQFELRFADNKRIVIPADPGVEAYRYATRWAGVLVALESQFVQSDTLRFSVDIPGKASGTSDNARDEETPATLVQRAGSAILAVRARCRNTVYCHYPVCGMVAHGTMRQLANDGCISILESFPSLTHDAQNTDTR